MIVVVHLLDHRGTRYLRTYPLGTVEIRNPKTDTTKEREAIRCSAAAFSDERPDECMRIATIVTKNVAEDEAERIAEERFNEALDILGYRVRGFSPAILLASGFVENLEWNTVSPRMPTHGRQQSLFLHVAHEQFPQFDWPQFLLAQAESELAQRLIRSHHWSRRAHDEVNLQLRVLFRWFAMEAIWMVSRNDDIIPRLQWALGFPNGSGARALSSTFTQRLRAHPTISTWKPKIENLLTEVRTFRNKSIHDGFRYQDIPRAKLKDFDHITLLACARVQNLAQSAIRSGQSTASEMLEYLPVLIEMDPLYIADVHGTVLFGLENPIRFTRGD